MNLQQAYDLFILSREEYCQDKTITNYKNNLRYFLDFMAEHKGMPTNEIDIETISKTDLSAYTLYLREKPKYKNHPFNIEMKESITKRSVKTYQVDVRTFFNFLYNEEYIKTQLTKKFKIIKAEQKVIIPLSVDDVAILDGLYNPKTEIGLRNLCILHLMLDAGLRRSEVINLELKHVSFDHNYILVVDGKGSKDRTVPLAPRLKKLLRTYSIAYRPACDHDYFLCNGNMENTQLTENAIKMLFSRMKKHTELSRLYPHLLRHTFATAYIMQGGDLESLRMYLGHTDISITQKYLHLANQFGTLNYDVYKLNNKFFRKYT
ncbi:MAG: tyrosine-type recombinase/integrase [Ruminococcus flavefaciens]|nr:tyrosine-type recombinase/integrase [Ruminococcus flavefaciens]